MIEELVKRQPKIKHSLFPTGVVTLDGRVIGQEIPFFDNAITLSEFCNKVINKTTSPKEAIKIHLEILKIMRELYENGIYYLDGHNNNFMVLKGDNHNITDGTNINMIAMIDYSPENIVFDELDEYKKKRLFECLRNYCLSILNYRFGINKIVGPFPYFYSFDELEEIILEQDHILTKTIHK